MARSNNTAEPLVAIDLLVAKVGYPAETIWKQLAQQEVHEDWDHTPCVTWNRARELFDKFTLARETSDRENAAAMAKQLDAEAHARAWPVRAFEAAAKGARVLRGVETSFPGDDHAPDWMDA